MEQTVNTFSKGLQLDTHPMVQGNESLSDALNATMVTMNGNEVILQNDMGNRRVDHAYLPPGYTPVGIKEYGGIIYIAAYNPITNMSQVGSFPSPELYISSVDSDDLGNEINFCNGFSKDSDNFLKEDTILYPLTDKNSLHIGDKFIICSNYIWNYKTFITEFDGITDADAKPMYTLLIGILNSLNEFVDITNSLKKFRKTESSNGSMHLYEYFISPILDSNPLSIEDGKLTLERELSRNIIDANTYSYKLVGPLYLKVILNHITNFNYSIIGELDESNKFSLIVTANFEYKYTPSSNFSWFKLKPRNSTEWELTDLNNDEIISENGKTTIIRKYTLIKKGLNTIFDYIVDVPAFINSTPCNSNIDNTCFLKEFHDESSLNVNLFGTGKIDFLGYRFYNDWDEVSDDAWCTLICSLNAYPKKDLNFRDLRIRIIECITNQELDEFSELLIHEGNFGTGKYQIRFLWSDLLIDFPRNLFRISFLCNNDEEIDSDDWFLTTNLFNECFLQGSKYIGDFRRFINPQSSDPKYRILTDKLSVKVDVIPHIENNSPEINIPKSIEPFISTRNNFTIENTYELYLDINAYSETIIVNEINYPINIKLSNNIKNEHIPQINLDFYNEKIEYNNPNTQNSELITYDSLKNAIIFKDRYTATRGSAVTVAINNCFMMFSDYLDNLVNQTNYLYGGVHLDYFTGKKYHFVDVVISANKKSLCSGGSRNYDYGGSSTYIEGNKLTKGYNIVRSTGGSGVFLLDNIIKGIYNSFNSHLPESLLFTYHFDNGSNADMEIIKRGILSGVETDIKKDNTQYARVWWRGVGDTWVLLDSNDLYSYNNSIAGYIENFIPGNTVFCAYESYYINDVFYKGTNPNYNKKYSFDIEFPFEFNPDINAVTITNSGDLIKFNKTQCNKRTQSIFIKISSSDLFLKEINSSINYSTVNLNNKFYYNLNLYSVDYLNNVLNPNSIYQFQNNQIVKLNNPIFYCDKSTVSLDSNNNKYYRLLINQTKINSHSFNSEDIGQYDLMTLIDLGYYSYYYKENVNTQDNLDDSNTDLIYRNIPMIRPHEQ